MHTRRQAALLLASAGFALNAGRVHACSKTAVGTLILDGDWQAGLNRQYNRVLKVPGLAGDPAQLTAGTLWYRRDVAIPKGSGAFATLMLKGARFAPEVYVNGVKVSASEGGMAATTHHFAIPKSAQAITLEIALKSLKDLDPKDASYVPGADQWRNNVSSYLWDSVVLRLHGQGEIMRVKPTSHIATDQVALAWELGDALPPSVNLRFSLIDVTGVTCVDSGPQTISATTGNTILRLNGQVKPWSPEAPNLYRLRTELLSGNQVVDISEQNFGLREFVVKGLGFELNGTSYPIRMGTVVWHRWSRDPEARDIAFDPMWFENNVVARLKTLGANALRFHLGLPPEALLDLCDTHGLAVQMEWSFFHGIGASEASMKTQWQTWLDTATRHPSVVIIQPWNETGGDQLKPAQAAIDALRPQYPPLVMDHAELIPIHKYWWSLFENLGLYYDSAAQFGQAVMVDEFGGNYLDGNGDPGSYPTTRETFLRFLGRHHTAEERLQLQADSNARVAEYWRRLGVAGFSPFAILGSHEDGNHWYLGPTNIPSPKPKPVWAALSAAFARQSLSLEIWNRNFAPGEAVSIPLWFFNEGDQDQVMASSLHIVNTQGDDTMPPLRFQMALKAHTSATMPITVPLPSKAGEWRIEARLTDPFPATPVVSAWTIRTLTPQPSARLKTIAIGVSEDEMELRAFLHAMNLRVVAPADTSARVVLGSRATWQTLQNAGQRETFEVRLRHGASVVLLDAGPQPLGVGYDTNGPVGGPLEGAPTVPNPAKLQELTLLGGIKVAFTEVAEPESTIQPAADNNVLWQGLPKAATWLWNGLRGGLIVPAADMQVSGLSGKALLAVWQGRGADPAKVMASPYFAYELAGYYAFSSQGNDRTVSDALRKRVTFLVDDAPALAGVVNPNAPITVTDLHALYLEGRSGGSAESLTALANAGKSLSRTPVVKLTFGDTSGSLILSQLLTHGRLRPGVSENGPGVYGLRYDPATAQMVLNIIDAALSPQAEPQ